MSSSQLSSFIYQKVTPYRLLIFFTSLLFLPKALLENPNSGVDPSWKISINMALHQGLSFGKDWVFTYGPLGFLSTRITAYVGIFPLLVYDAFAVGVLIYILRFAFKDLNDLSKCLTIPYLIMMTSHNSEATFQLFMLFLFLIFHNYRTKSLISIGLATILCILIFFIKLNLGIVTSLILFIYFILLVITKQNSVIKVILFLTLHLLGIYLMGRVFNVDLFGYLKGALSIINNYNDAMFSVDFINLTARYAYYNITIAAIIIITFLVFFICSIPLILKSKSDIFILLVMLFALYLGFKQGFTRFGFAGMSYPFFYGALFVGISYLFIENVVLKNRLGNVFLIFLLLSPFASTGLGFSFNKITLPYQDVIFSNLPFQQKVSDQKHRLEYQIDPKIVRSFKGKTCDVVPTEISYIYFNNLIYNPRPAIQSYQAYNNYLTTLNYNKYTSKTAPDFVLYTKSAPTDVQRYSFWSDSKTTLALIQNYDYETTTINRDTIQILKKRKALKRIVKSDVKDLYFKIGDRVEVSQANKLTWIEVKVRYSVWGKLLRVLVQPQVLRVRVTFEDGETEVLKAIISEIDAGIFLKKFQTDSDAQHFFKTRGNNKSITHLQFLQNNAGFDENITAHLYNISFR